nr:hypothetical protein [Tanacetum cinerariifolium]
MAQPVQNINYSAFRSMFEREKLSGTNFNNGLRRLKLVLRVKKIMFVIEHPIPPAPAADFAANEIKLMFEKQARVEKLDLIQTFYACKQEEGFVRNYNMHNMGKMIGELHVMLIKYEKGLPKKAETPQVMMIKGGLRMIPAIIARRWAIRRDSTYLWHCRLAHISKKRIEKLQQERLLKSTDDESFDQCVSCLSSKMTRKLFPHHPERATDLLEIIHTDVCGPLRHVSRQGASYFITFTDDYSHYGYVYLLKHKHEGYALESATRILNMVPTKKVDKTPYELWYAEFFEKNLITQEVSGRAIDLEEIQDEDTSPSEITSEIPKEVEGFEPPQEEVILIRKSERTHRAPNRLCLNIEAEEHSLGDLNEPTSYKVKMLDSESNKWLDAMNAEMQSMIDNKVWVLDDLPFNCKNVGSKWIFKKKTDMDGIVHTYKARLVVKGYTQLYGVYYKETFSPVADIKALRILISITMFYDYEIWKVDVKTAFLNGYLDEDIYMVQPKGFVDPNHPRKVCKL